MKAWLNKIRPLVGVYVGESSHSRVSEVVRNGFCPSTVWVVFFEFFPFHSGCSRETTPPFAVSPPGKNEKMSSSDKSL